MNAGTIEKVVLRNFMCHEYLQVEFDSNLNIVIGSNGSGKSAILTGIVLVLGGKALNTNRATNMRDLIKTGCSFSSIEITLRNKGRDSYKFDVYGEKIIIEKRLLQNSSAKYKIKTANQKTITTNREDLDMIVEHFNIQICNPVCILTQETSRKFLSSSHPKAKYNIFLNATNLSQMKSRILYTIEKQCDSEKALSMKVEACQQYKEYVAEIKNKLEIQSQMMEISQRIDYLKHQIEWAAYNVDFKEYEKHDKEKCQLEKVLSKLELKISKNQSKIELEKSKLRKIEDDLKRMGTETNALLKKKGTATSNYKNIQMSIQSNKNSIEYTKNELNQIEKSSQELSTKIEQLKSKDEKSRENEKKEIYAKLDELNTKKAELELKQTEFEKKRRIINMEIDQKKQMLVDTTNEHCRLQNALKKKEQQYERLHTSNSHLTVYSRETPKFLEDIDIAYRQGLFDRKPLGPIGSLISLKDNKWALATEVSLKKLLLSYCVHSHKDKSTLLKMANKYYNLPQFMPNIIVTKFQDKVYDIPLNQLPMSTFPSLLNIIQCDHPTVLNMLIDHASIEKILCVDDIEVAKQLMIRNPPKNTIKAYTLDGDEFMVNFNMGNSRFYSSIQKSPRFLVQNINFQKQELIDRIRNDRDLVEISTKKCQQLKLEYQLLQNDLSSISKNLDDIKRGQYNIRLEKKELEDLIEHKRHAANLSDLENELKEMIDKKDKMKNNIEIAVDSVNQLEKQLCELKNVIDSINSENERIKLLYDSKKDEEVALNRKISSLHYKIDNISHGMQKCKQQLENSLVRSNALLATLQEREMQLKSVGEPTNDAKRSPKDINSEIDELTIKLNHSKSINAQNVEQLQLEYEKESKRLLECVKSIENLKAFTETLKNQLVIRKRKYETMQSNLTVKLKKYFSSILQYRGFDGTLNFDHIKEELTINMSLRDDSINIKDIKSLSGGERSFSTLAFVVSLWMTMDSPFRCLDEFDVFMDSVNRKICFDLLIDYVKKNPSNQLIIFTPQDISEIKHEETISILKLAPPIR